MSESGISQTVEISFRRTEGTMSPVLANYDSSRHGAWTFGVTLGGMECGTFAFECKHGSLDAVVVRIVGRPGGLGKAAKWVG